MKVYIGPYVSWIGPYQIADMIFFWCEKYPEKELAERWDYKLHDRLGPWLAKTWVGDFCQWFHEKKKRTEIIHIDGYDVWGADHTISLIVVPILKKLKEVKHGSPFVDPEDVPKEFKPTAKERKAAEAHGGWDDKNHARWEWVLDEMIWAHEQIIDDDGDSKFFDHTEAEKETDFTKSIRKIKVDRKGLDAHHARIKHGLYLFGKYYRALWD